MEPIFVFGRMILQHTAQFYKMHNWFVDWNLYYDVLCTPNYIVMNTFNIETGEIH